METTFNKVIMETTFNTAYGPKNQHAHNIHFEPQGRTKQAHAEESNINIILAKYIKTGLLEHAQVHSGSYEFATSNDFQTSMNLIIKAQDMFNDLPSAVRKRFANDPKNFLDFVQDEENTDELIKMGLANNIAPVDDASLLDVVEGGNPPTPAENE